MADPNWVDVGTLVVDVSTVMLAVAGGSIGLWQYRNAQRWKQLEFVAEQIREFESDPKAANAMFMLDWNERSIELYPQLEEPKSRFVVVNDTILYRALATRQEDTTECFTDNDAEIRACFDTFFGYLQRFDQFIDSGLVRQADFWPYLRYWVKLIGDKSQWGKNGAKSPILMRQIWDFLLVYAYSDVVRLFRRYGTEIVLTSNEKRELERTSKLLGS